MYVILNGRQIDTSGASVSPLGQGFLYGYGLFETIKVQAGKPVLLERHLDRLAKGCAQLALPWTVNAGKLTEQCTTLLTANRLTDGSLKILVAKNQDAACDLLISSRQNPYTPEQYAAGFALCLADSRRDPSSKLTYLKTCNYLENLLAREAATATGYQEAVFLNDQGVLCEGSFTNLFFVKDQILYTPQVECGLLPGVVRQEILDLAAHLGLPCETGAYPVEALHTADEVFVTNALLTIMPVARFQETAYDLQANPVTSRLQRVFPEAVHPVYEADLR